ncbi:MAG TPA: HAMP domain-containing sensor histidine kinase [Methylotenera sp.]|nr:HAMP domain-containing sensor histidine kinase [Methylotenera sp.]
MTLESGQIQNKKLSPTSQRMLELREAVLDEFITNIQTGIPKTKKLLYPILINTLPAFYDQIAEAVTDDYPGINALDSTSIPAEHGGERARLTDYDHQTLITEYQIFRRTVFEVLHKNAVPLNHHEIMVINAFFDMGIREAINAFSMVHSALREQFMAALTHDLRDPLSTAKLVVELIMMIDDPIKMKGYAAKINDHLSRMNGMILQLLNSMMFENNQSQPLNLINFDMMDLAQEVQLEASSMHGQRFQLDGDPVNGWWDRELMKRAIENMIGNAVKYGDQSKPIIIKTIEIHERLLLTVHNEGRPIPLEEQESIFQIFKRAHSAKEGKQRGWGIGLSFVRGVAESHGGSVGVESTIERGTTFLIDVPVDGRPFQNSPTLS